jgi:hypothetical protein
VQRKEKSYAPPARWTTPDWASRPVAVPYAQFATPQTLNLYAYVGNNPLLHFDPDGHCWPISACADIVIAKVNQAQQYVQNKAIATGSPALAAAATFTSGVAKDVINGVASLGKVGQATGTCMRGNGCTGGQWAKAVGGDVLKATAIAGGIVGVAAKAGAAIETLGTASRAGAASEAGSETTALFRAVKPGELQDIQATGVFRNPFGIESKYFSTSAEGAQNYANMAQAAYGDGPYSLVSSSIPTDLITPEMQVTVDRGIQTIVVPTDTLPELSGPEFVGPIE